MAMSEGAGALGWAFGELSYPPYRELQRIIPANTKNRDQILAQFDGFLKQMGKLNYWFFAEETPK